MKHFLSRLQDTTKSHWDKNALNTFEGESFTFGQMAENIAKLNLLYELCGVKKGDKVALCARNVARWAIVYLSSNVYQSIAVPILPDFTPESVTYLCDHSESKILFVNKDKWEKMDVAKLPSLLLAVEAESWELLYAKEAKYVEVFDSYLDEFAKRYPDGYKATDLNYPIDNFNNICTINYTSGSTGSPKGVMLTYKNFSAVVEYTQNKIPATIHDNMVSMLPMAHMYGLVIEFIYPICAGVSIYWLGKTPTPSTLLRAMAQVKPYLLITVPLVMEKIFKAKVLPAISKPFVKFLIKVPGVNKLIFNKIRKSLIDAFGGKVQEFIFGGAALNPEVEKWLNKINLPYVVGYGMTEACPLIAYIDHEHFKMGSCGRAIDCNVVRIDSVDPQNIVGEIQVKGDNVCLGYYKNEEATKNLFTDDGYLHTGDLGIIDKDGNIFIKGRSKNMILGPSGQNIYPEEIEAVINNQDHVLESVFVDRKGKLTALIFPDYEAVKGANLSLEQLADQIKSSANSQLPNYSQIADVEFVKEAFEKTPKMSIKRFLYM